MQISDIRVYLIFFQVKVLKVVTKEPQKYLRSFQRALSLAKILTSNNTDTE